MSRPRAASRRKPDAVIVPSGKANLAATDSRIGALGAMSDSITSVLTCEQLPCRLMQICFFIGKSQSHAIRAIR